MPSQVRRGQCNWRLWIQRLLTQALKCAWLASAVLLLTVVRPSADEYSVVAPNENLTKLAEGYSFAEGPAADGDGNVFFTDSPNNRIVKLNTVDGTLSDWLKPAGEAVGAHFDQLGNLVVAATETGELWSIAPDKQVTVIAKDFEGKLFNGPNDLWIRPDGGIYFTDPDFSSPRDQSARVEGQNVYFVTADRKSVRQVATDLFKPNGIVGTPDGKILYVADYAAGKTFSYEVLPDGSLTNKRQFCNSGSDGMTIDNEGNLYLTTSGVTVVDRTGQTIERIDVPEPTTNVTFGSKTGDVLFITAGGSLYAIKMKVKRAH